MKLEKYFKKALAAGLSAAMLLGSTQAAFAQEPEKTETDVIAAELQDTEADAAEADVQIIETDVQNNEADIPENDFRKYEEDIQYTELQISDIIAEEPLQLESPGAEIKISYQDFNENFTEYKVIVEGLDVNAGNVISAGVWSDQNGQDDLKWVYASIKPDGTAEVTVKISDYKDPGRFFAHFYQVNSKNVKNYVIATQFEVPAVKSADVQTVSIDKNSGKAVIEIRNIDSPAGVKKIKVPTWSKSNQSDIVWYEAKEDESGVYTVEVNIANHGNNPAAYSSHVYIEDMNGFLRFAGSVIADFRVTAQNPVITYDNDKHTCSVTIETDCYPASVKNVQIAVWSKENGQDDLKWITMKHNAYTGLLTAEFDTDFLLHRGTVYIHAYMENKNGQKSFLSAGDFSIADTEIESINVTKDVINGTFKVTEVNVKNLLDKEVLQAAVWSKADQSDIVWYDLKKNGNDYEVTVNIKNHKYNVGKYQVHVYRRSANGYKKYMNGVSVDMNVSYTSVEAVDKHAGETGREQIEYTGTVKGITFPAGMASARAAVWNEKKGTSTLKWYDISLMKNSDGTYDGNFDININNHKEAGKYIIHVYGKTRAGCDVFIAGYDGLVIDANDTKLNVAVTDKNGSAATFKVTAEVLQGISGVSNVKFAVWTEEGGQDDLKWYTGEKQTDGSYQITAKAANHKFGSGKYNIHAYATTGNGQYGYAGGTSAEFTVSENTVMVRDGLEEIKRTIAINNPSKTPVRFAVWNEKGGQANGIQWIDAKQEKFGLWTGTASCEVFKDDGRFIVHAYSGSTYLGASTFEWNARKAQLKLNSNMEMFNIAKTLDSPTPYLIVLNRAIHRVAIYQGSAGNWKEIYYWPCVVGKPSTPTPAGLFHIKGRFDWFGDGHKSWWATQIEGYYYFHSQIYYWDDAPRVVLDPAMDTAASAGCVRLYEPNALWIYRNIPRGTTVYIY